MNLYLQPWRKYADITGRAGLPEFWIFTLVNAVIFFLVGICSGVLISSGSEGGEEGSSVLLLSLLSYAFALATLVPSIAVGVRRLHDSNKTGWLWLLFLVPVIGNLVLLILFILPGTPGENRYGAPSTP